MDQEFKFTSPSGRPQKISLRTQATLDKWRSYGIEPPPVRPNESQEGYLLRITNQLENRKRGYYGGEEKQTYGRIDPRENRPLSREGRNNAARGPSSLAKGMVSLRASPRKTLGMLLGIGTAGSAMSNKNR